MPATATTDVVKDEEYFGAQLVLLYKAVIRHIGTLAADEADERRKITLDRDNTAPYEEDRGDGSGASSSQPGVGRRLRLLDRRRAERHHIEETEQDDRSLVIHEEFVEHTRLYQECQDDIAELQRQRELQLNVARDLLEREATLGVLRLLAQWTLSFDAIKQQAAVETPAVARVSADRRAIEREETKSRAAIASYRDTLYSALLRTGYGERDAITPIQVAYADNIIRTRDAKLAQALAAMKATKDAEDRLTVIQVEVEGRRTLRNLEQSAFADITKMAIASTGKIIRSRQKLQASQSQAFSPVSPLSPSTSYAQYF